jgi:hypothetical protein
MQDPVALLLRSKSFLEWSPHPTTKPSTVTAGRGRSFTYLGKRYTNLVVDEKHFAPAELAKAWGVSAETKFSGTSQGYCAWVPMAIDALAVT